MIKHKRAFSALSIEKYIAWKFSSTAFWIPVAESLFASILFLFIKLAYIQMHPSIVLDMLRDSAIEIRKGITDIKQGSRTDMEEINKYL